MTRIILPVFVALHGLLIAQTSAPDVRSADVRSAMAQLRKDRFRAHMAFLADDLLEAGEQAPGVTS